MNCQFCFTGRMGLRGNLSTAQIVEQVRYHAPACSKVLVRAAMVQRQPTSCKSLPAALTSSSWSVPPLKYDSMPPLEFELRVAGAWQQRASCAMHSPANIRDVSASLRLSRHIHQPWMERVAECLQPAHRLASSQPPQSFTTWIDRPATALLTLLSTACSQS